MSMLTPVNSQVTDSVSQAGMAILGNAPAIAAASLYQSAAHATGIMYQNSVQAQQQAAISGQAATNMGVIQIYSLNSMAAATASAKLGQSDCLIKVLTLLVAMKVIENM